MSQKLLGLNYLAKAPSKGAVDKIITIVFARRADGLSDNEKGQIAQLLGLNTSQTAELLIAVRLLVRAALRPGISVADVISAIPEGVDRRLCVILAKILQAHIEDWHAELEPAKPAKKAAAAAPAAPEKPVEAPAEKVKPAPAPAPVAPQPVQSAPAPVRVPERAPEKTKAPEQKGNVSVVSAAGAVRPSLPRLEGLGWRVDLKSASDNIAHMSVPSVIVQMKVENPQIGPKVEDAPKSRIVTFELSKEALATMLDGLIFVRDQLAGIGK